MPRESRSPALPSSIPRALGPLRWAVRGTGTILDEGEGKEAVVAIEYGGYDDEGEGPRGNVFDHEGVKLLMELAGERFPLSQRVWTSDTTARGKGRPVRRKSVRFECGGCQDSEAVGLGADGTGTASAPSLDGLAGATGGREGALVSGSEPQDEPGLRAAVGELRGVRTRSDIASHGEVVSSLVSIFPTVSSTPNRTPTSGTMLTCQNHLQPLNYGRS